MGFSNLELRVLSSVVSEILLEEKFVELWFLFMMDFWKLVNSKKCYYLYFGCYFKFGIVKICDEFN